jgi:hypothetical protein
MGAGVRKSERRVCAFDLLRCIADGEHFAQASAEPNQEESPRVTKVTQHG